MLKYILPMIPPHVCYCEPFAGGLAVLLAKERSSVEIVNDINGDLVALYRNLQYHLPALMGEIQWLFASRQNLYDFIAQPGLTELQRASRFLLRNRTSFGGKGTSFGVVKTAGGGVAFDRKAVGELLGKAHERLNGVVVEHLPFDRCLDNYDSKDSFHFIDPPYLNASTDAYDGFTEADMRSLRKRVGKLKGKWLVTVDDSPLNRELFSDCELKPISTQNRLCNVRTHSQPAAIRRIDHHSEITMHMLADVGSASNGQLGTWVVILFAVINGAVGIITVFGIFATRREVDKIDQRVTELERTDTTIRGEMQAMKDALIYSAERRSAVLHNRLNPVVEALAELKGTNEALLSSFNNISTVMKEGLETLRKERK